MPPNKNIQKHTLIQTNDTSVIILDKWYICAVYTFGSLVEPMAPLLILNHKSRDVGLQRKLIFLKYSFQNILSLIINPLSTRQYI